MADVNKVIAAIADPRTWQAPEESRSPQGPACYLRPRTFCLAVLFILTFCRYYAGFDPSRHFPVHGETYSIARNLADERQFANPFAPLRTGPSAHLAPAFPFLMASVMRMSGNGFFGRYVWNLMGAAAVSTLVAMLPLAGERLGMRFLTGVLAGLLWVIARPTVPFGWECHWTALMAAASILVVGGGGSRVPVRAALPVGLLCGMALLTSPPASVPMFAMGLLFAGRRARRASFIRWACWIGIIPALMVVPWIVRNYSVFRAFIPVRDNFGMELAVSYNDCAVFGIRLGEQTGCTQRQHPNVSLDQAQQVLRMGEANYNRFRLHQALQWIAAHPRRSLGLWVQRVIAFWFPSDAGRPLDEVVKPGKRVQHAVIYVLTLLSLPGIAVLARRNRFSAALFGIWLLLDPAVYYVIQYEDRYRMPILWMTFLPGACGGMSLLEYMLRKIPFVSDDSALLPGPRAHGTHDAC